MLGAIRTATNNGKCGAAIQRIEYQARLKVRRVHYTVTVWRWATREMGKECDKYVPDEEKVGFRRFLTLKLHYFYPLYRLLYHGLQQIEVMKFGLKTFGIKIFSGRQITSSLLRFCQVWKLSAATYMYLSHQVLINCCESTSHGAEVEVWTQMTSCSLYRLSCLHPMWTLVQLGSYFMWNSRSPDELATGFYFCFFFNWLPVSF